jgi:hypothetical protein
MAAADALRETLIAGDHRQMARIWAEAFPHLPPLETDEAAEIAMHRARTEAESVPLSLRAWSHRWMVERGYPSGLPDRLRPSAEQLSPKVAEMVGIFVKPASEATAPAAAEIRQAMTDAVSEAYADGRTDPAFVRARIAGARKRARLSLFGERITP